MFFSDGEDSKSYMKSSGTPGGCLAWELKKKIRVRMFWTVKIEFYGYELFYCFVCNQQLLGTEWKE